MNLEDIQKQIELANKKETFSYTNKTVQQSQQSLSQEFDLIPKQKEPDNVSKTESAINEIQESDTQETDTSAPTSNTPQELTVEDKARLQGWRPKEEYHGDPDKWVDAKTFITNGSYLREIDKYKRIALEATRVANEALSKSNKAAELAYQQALQDLQTQKKAVKSIGDTDGLEKLITQENKLKEEYIKSLPKPSANRAFQEHMAKESTQQWLARNPWTKGDTDEAQFLLMKAKEHSQKLYLQRPDLTMDQEQELIEDYLSKTFPNSKYFEGKQQVSTPKVAAASSRIGTKTEAYQTINYKDKKQLLDYVDKVKLVDKTAAEMIKFMALNNEDVTNYIATLRKNGLKI